MPEGKCYMKIRKPAQAFLEAEGECHMKIHKPIQTFLGAEGQGPTRSFRTEGARSQGAQAKGNPKP
jgi:hypothetical protein